MLRFTCTTDKDGYIRVYLDGKQWLGTWHRQRVVQHIELYAKCQAWTLEEV